MEVHSPTSNERLNAWSLCSILSAVSILALSSVGSVASIFSLGSAGSLLSVASTGSVMSVASNQCVMKMFTDCSVEYNITSAVTIEIPDDTFETMETCTKEEYKSVSRPERCDYQLARCTYHDHETGLHVDMECEVRRKGSSTWKEMRDKPSFKVKMDDEVHFKTTACPDGVRCPPGQTANVWNAKKFTLNNNGYPSFYTKHGEVDAYDAFRHAGKFAVPNAHYTRVTLKKGAGNHSTVIREDTYALIETIDDKRFLQKWFGDDYGLWEVEMDMQKFERDGGSVDVDSMQVPDLLHLNMSQLETRDMIRYYVGEELTGHWDGACLRTQKNNYYVGYDGDQFTMIPSGVDNTFQGCVVEFATADEPQCLFMQQCMHNASCRAIYDEIRADAFKTAKRTTPTCGEELFPSMITLISCLAGAALVTGLVKYAQRKALLRAPFHLME